MDVNKKRPGFMLYFTFKPMFDYLPDEKAGKLIKACFDYALKDNNDYQKYFDVLDENGCYVETDSLLDGYFEVLRNALDQDEKRYIEISKKRQDAGRKGGNTTAGKNKTSSKRDDFFS